MGLEEAALDIDSSAPPPSSPAPLKHLYVQPKQSAGCEHRAVRNRLTNRSSIFQRFLQKAIFRYFVLIKVRLYFIVHNANSDFLFYFGKYLGHRKIINNLIGYYLFIILINDFSLWFIKSAQQCALK